MEISEKHFVNGNNIRPPHPDGFLELRVGMGCFWGAEKMFWQLEGVHTTSVGYSGGVKDQPTYREVCSGTTGHAEVIQIDYNPRIISYKKLLDVFWQSHDPTTLNRQGADIGTQYRSIIFHHNKEQEKQAQGDGMNPQDLMKEYERINNECIRRYGWRTS